MKLAASIGIPINDFWHMEPYELNIYADAYKKRREIDNEYTYNLCILQAFLTSRWVWKKRVDIEKHLTIEKQENNMTDSEMLAKVKALNALMGGNVKQAD